MTIYRANANLDTGQRLIRKGSLLVASDLTAKALAALMAKRHVTPVAAPPLSILPGWASRAEALLAVGVITVGDFLEASDEIIIDALASTDPVTATEVSQWRAIAWRYLVAV